MRFFVVETSRAPALSLAFAAENKKKSTARASRSYMKTTRQWKATLGKNFKIYEDLNAKPLNPDWVARVVFSYTNPSNLSAAVAIAAFQIYALVRFWNHAYDFRPNCTPLSSITIINSISFEFAESLSHDQLLRGPIKLNFMCKKRNSYI